MLTDASQLQSRSQDAATGWQVHVHLHLGRGEYFGIFGLLPLVKASLLCVVNTHTHTHTHTHNAPLLCSHRVLPEKGCYISTWGCENICF